MLRSVAAGAVCAVLLAGCGGGGAHRESFVTAARATCGTAPRIAGANVRGASGARIVLTRFANQEAAVVHRLERAELPAGRLRAAAEDFLRGARAFARRDAEAVRRARHGSIGAAFSRSAPDAAALAAFKRGARRLGATACLADPTTTKPATPDTPPPAGLSAGRRARFLAGRGVLTQSGCLACHRIGADGNGGPGPDLTHIASKLPPQAIRRVLRDPTAPMPSYKNLPRDKLDALVAFLAVLR